MSAAITVKFQTNMHLHKQGLQAQQAFERADEKKKANFVAVIISVTSVCTEENRNKGDIQLQ